MEGTRGRRRRIRGVAVHRVPTDRELEVLLAYLETGRYDLAAERLGLSTGYVSDVLESIRLKAGAVNTPQAVWRLRVVLSRFERRRAQQVPPENKA